MLPHSQGEAASIAEAFHECDLALHQFNKAFLDASASEWVKELEALMNTTGVVAISGEGLWCAKAQTFTTDEKIETSRLIDELAHWFSASD